MCSLPSTSCKIYISHLRLHQAIHHIGIEVPCSQEGCPRTFTNFRYLKAHIEKEHDYLLTSSLGETKCHIEQPTQSLVSSQADAYGESMDSDDVINANSSAVNLTSSFMSFVGQLQSKANLSLSNIKITENLQIFLTDVAQYACNEVKNLGQLESKPLLI